MHFVFVTLFPSLIESYFSDSILARAIKAGKISIEFVSPRDFSDDKWSRTDDTVVGGGAGMVMTPQPLFALLAELKKRYADAKVLMMTPAGKNFKQNDAVRFAKQTRTLIFLAGRYEGIDERVIETFVDEVFCIGDYILTGGELPSLVMCDAIARNVEGVLGNQDSLTQESFNDPLIEAPSFGKPPLYARQGVPSVLLKGNHSKISLLKKELSVAKTKFFRPDLFENYRLRNS